MIRVSDSYVPLLRRPFGAHEIGKDRIAILYKVVGKATKILSSKKKGKMLDVLGPLGNGFNIEASIVRAPEGRGRPSSIVLVAGGHGVAPLYALAKQLLASSHQLSVFIGARTKAHVICEKEFKKLGAKVYIATDDGSKGRKGLITSLLKNRLRALEIHKAVIYGCGPKAMLKEVGRIAKAKKIPCQLSLEEYMACGTGTCLGCAVKTRSGYKLVCKDGPVFDSKEIVWQ
ncbi:MAG: dihydroorotate dehydrogenase electron transfer subunit [Candidatus Omnitrophica bacterium]|nr:dihydroorotate dehydrogenase electron transfer subunit [Candidatus Omnitrophota bacterium]